MDPKPLTPLEAARAETRLAIDRADQRTAEIAAHKRAIVERAIAHAIQRGAIPTRAFDLQAKWREKCAKDNELVELLDAIPGSAALKPSVEAVESFNTGAPQ